MEGEEGNGGCGRRGWGGERVEGARERSDDELAAVGRRWERSQRSSFLERSHSATNNYGNPAPIE